MLILRSTIYRQTLDVCSGHLSSDWQVASDPDFNNIIYESLDDEVHREEIIFDSTDITPIYARVRHKARRCMSEWSPPAILVLPGDVPPLTGSGSYVYAYPPNTTTGNSIDEYNVEATGIYTTIQQPTMSGIGLVDIETPVPVPNLTLNGPSSITSTPFTLLSGNDTHYSTDWYVIMEDNGVETIVFQSLNDTVNLETISFNSPLPAPNYYRVEVFYRGQSGATSPYGISPSVFIDQ